MEEWVILKDFPLYEVNRKGEIRNKKTKRIKKPQMDSWGYNQVGLSNGSKKTIHKTVHRLVAKTFLDSARDDLQVNHIDGNKTNNSIDNLEFVTGSQNVKHAYDSGIRKPSGGRGPIRKIRIVETGEVFDNMADCAKRVCGDSGNICRCVHDRSKSYKGFHYEAI